MNLFLRDNNMSDKTLSIVETLTALANGVNPITGEILEKNNVYNDPEVIRVLFNTVDLIKNIKTPREVLRPSNAGSPWTQDKDAELISLFKENPDLKLIAKHLGRSTGSIQSRLLKLGLVSINYD